MRLLTELMVASRRCRPQLVAGRGCSLVACGFPGAVVWQLCSTLMQLSCLLQVRTLFAGLAIKPGGVHVVVGPEAAAVSAAGLPMAAAGCTFVEFASPGDALRALVSKQCCLQRPRRTCEQRACVCHAECPPPECSEVLFTACDGSAGSTDADPV